MYLKKFIINYIMNFNRFKEEFENICVAWSVPVPHIHESADFMNHTSSTDVHVHLEDGEEIKAQAAHIFGHYVCEVHCDQDYYQDIIANKIMEQCITTG
jgi:hypothetical protein